MVAVIRVLAELWGLVLHHSRRCHDVFYYYVYLIIMGKTKPLPPIENKVLLMSATQLAEKIRIRELKSEDVVRAYVDRARSVQPHINAITDARYEDALEDARIVDRFLAKGEKSAEEIEKNTPLLGVPFTCKETVGIKGLLQTAGVAEAKNRKCDEDSVAAGLYKSAGAIPISVTNVPQLCMWWNTSNVNFGTTWNPFNNHRTVGGSSGGEGALLTSAGAVIGIGTDLGGSIRIPSSFNGIYGHKPTAGVVSNKGAFPDDEGTKKLDHINCTGPMCRYVEDLPLLMKILSVDDNCLKLQEQVDFHKVKVYSIESFPGKISAEPALRKAVRNAANYFHEQYGVEPIPLKMAELEYAFNFLECMFLEAGALPIKLALADKNGKVNNLWLELFKSLFGLSNHMPAIVFFGMIQKIDKDQSHYEFLEKFRKVEQKFLDIFKEDAIVLLPTHPEISPYLHLTFPKYLNIGYTCLFNPMGFPATNVPAGLCRGLPMGVQVVSGHFKDHLTIAAAQELDKCFGGWTGPSVINVR